MILDEPFVGLDPVNQILLKDILLELRQRNTAIVFSTHQMEQVEKMCDSICLINKGKPVLSGELRSIKKQYGTNSIHLEFEGDGEFLKNFSFIHRADVYQNYAELELTDISKNTELLASINGKLALRKFEIVEPSLNSIFIHVVGGSEQIEQASDKSIPAIPSQKQKSTSEMIMQDRRMRKTLISLIGIVILSLGLSFVFLLQDPPKLILAAIMFIVILFSTLRFIQMRKKIEQELKAKGSLERRQ